MDIEEHYRASTTRAEVESDPLPVGTEANQPLWSAADASVDRKQ